MSAATAHRARSRSKTSSAAMPGGLVGDVAKYLVTRSLLKRVGRFGGIQGMVVSAAATYALNKFLNRRR